ncbi:hypothetical protein ACH419_30540 [Streptomyces bobili]|uniref:hypothetical protein n=1 Tax=Streptomyces bobili TaxID=67280 RepID=UPI0037B7E4C2
MKDVGLPGAFVSRLCDLQPVKDLIIELPFPVPVDHRDPEWLFWKMITERNNLRPPASLGSAGEARQEADRLFKHMMPLRHRPEVTASSFDTPTLEAFLHPFGWVLLATADLVWNPAVPLREAVQSLTERQADTARITLPSSDGHSIITTQDATVATAAEATADVLSERLAHDPSWLVEGHRLVTVIDGDVNPPLPPFAPMPRAGSPIHQAMHQMSSDATYMPPLKDAFVARWDNNGSFAWIPTDLVYMLGLGTSVVLPQAVAKRPDARADSTSGRHRQLALLLTYLSATVELIKSRTPGGPDHFEFWAEKAANHLTRLFSPTPVGRDYWGLESRAYLKKTGTIALINAIRSSRGESPLTPRYEPPNTYP